MQVDLEEKILDAEGKPIKDGVRYRMCADGMTVYHGEDGEPVIVKQGTDFTYKHAFNRALGTMKGDDDLAEEDKIKVFLLQLKVANGGTQDLSDDERALIKKRVGKAFGPLIFGRVRAFLEAPTAPPPAGPVPPIPDAKAVMPQPTPVALAAAATAGGA